MLCVCVDLWCLFVVPLRVLVLLGVVCVYVVDCFLSCICVLSVFVCWFVCFVYLSVAVEWLVCLLFVCLSVCLLVRLWAVFVVCGPTLRAERIKEQCHYHWLSVCLYVCLLFVCYLFITCYLFG